MPGVAELDELRRLWEKANTPAAHRAHMRSELRRLLPLRTRLRLWRDSRLTSAGGWLLDHGCERACVALWRVTGLWSG